MILPIYTYGQPVLRKVAEDIPADYPGLDGLIADMFDTLDASEGIGLAAPQVGKPIRLSVIDLDVVSDTYPEYKGFRRAFINPRIAEVDESSKKETYEEGCLSIPGIHEKVARHTRVRVTYTDRDGTAHDEWVEGFLARVMQHEFDHLDATLFTDRISHLRKQLVAKKLKNIAQGKYSCHYKTRPAAH